MTILQFTKPPHPNPAEGQPSKGALKQNFEVCAATIDDIDNIVSLMEKVRQNLIKAGNANHLKAKSREEIAALVKGQFPTIIVKDAAGKIVGFTFVTEQTATQGAANLDKRYNQGNNLSINSVTTDPDCKGQGIGSLLVSSAFSAAVEYAEKAHQETGKVFASVVAKVSVDNDTSQFLFSKNDFHPAGRGAVYTDTSTGTEYDFNVLMKPLPVIASSVEAYETREQAALRIREQRIGLAHH